MDAYRHALLAVACLSTANCAPGHSARTPRLTFNSDVPKTELVYVTTNLGKCANWDRAITLARARVGCDEAAPGSGCKQNMAKCSKLGTCDVCKLLAPGSGPWAYQENLSEPKDGKLPGWRGQTCPGWTIDKPGCGWGNWSSKAKVTFDDDLCSDPGHVNTLAEVAIEEALHSCIDFGGTRPIFDNDSDPHCEPSKIAKDCIE